MSFIYSDRWGIVPTVDYYADLPPAVDNTGRIYLVLNSSGIWGLPGYHSEGLYYSNGITWEKKTGTLDSVLNNVTLTDINGWVVGDGSKIQTASYTPYPDTNPAGYITEAPSDGEQYTRKDGDWSQMIRACLVWDSVIPFSQFYDENFSQFNQPVWVMLRGDGFQVDTGEYYNCYHIYFVGEKGSRNPQNIYCDSGVNFYGGLPNLYLDVAFINNSEETYPYTVETEPAPTVWYVGHGCVVGDRRKALVRFRRNTETSFNVETRGRLTEKCFYDQTSHEIANESAFLTISVFDGASIEEVFDSTNLNSNLHYQVYAPAYIAYPTTPAFTITVDFNNSSKNLFFDRFGSSLVSENVEAAIKEVSGSVVTNHSSLSGLAYEYSGHSGFASQGFSIAMSIALG